MGTDINSCSFDPICWMRQIGERLAAQKGAKTPPPSGGPVVFELDGAIEIYANPATGKAAAAEADKYPGKNVLVINKGSRQGYLFKDVNGQKEEVSLAELPLKQVDPYFAKRCRRSGKCDQKVALYFPAPVSLGVNRGAKVRAGDNKTPEGVYQVCSFNSGGKFVAGIQLNYPNQHDLDQGIEQGIISEQTYASLQRYLDKGLCPPFSPLGNLIKVHGSWRADEKKISLAAEDDPSLQFITGVDQTEGCIAFENVYAYYLQQTMRNGDVVVILP